MYENLITLADRLDQVRDQIVTEEATKTALILPFIRELGYDIFNPAEVVPEFTADVGIKKGEKVDYAIFRDGKPIILFECKTIGAKLNSYSSQLYRYFSVTNARIAILTDGVEYRFFSDLTEPNRLDSVPFFTFTLEKIRKDDALRLEQFSKPKFDLAEVLADAENLKIRTAIKAHVAKEFVSPSPDFTRYFADPIYSGRMTQAVLEKYAVLVRAAIADHIGEAVDRRLQLALQTGQSSTESGSSVSQGSDPTKAGSESSGTSSVQDEVEVITTMEELHGFYSIRAMLRDMVEPKRICSRDVRTYFGILLDDNNRKPICRLWFNRSQKYLGVFDKDKKEHRIALTDVDDLFNYVDRIRDSLTHVLNET
jgi:predicted type IV restriction endonuclease